jgi:hypothetical protein
MCGRAGTYEGAPGRVQRFSEAMRGGAVLGGVDER